MKATANLLRAYSAALHEARTPFQLSDRHLDFMGRHEVPVLPAPPRWVKMIRAAHRARVSGKGSPAECDEALARAIREIGGTNG
jgi:hypothetical protein